MCTMPCEISVVSRADRTGRPISPLDRIRTQYQPPSASLGTFMLHAESGHRHRHTHASRSPQPNRRGSVSYPCTVGNACGTPERREDLPSSRKIEAAPSSSTELRRSRHEPPRLEPARGGANRLKRLDGLIQIHIAFAIAFWLYKVLHMC